MTCQVYYSPWGPHLHSIQWVIAVLLAERGEEVVDEIDKRGSYGKASAASLWRVSQCNGSA